LLDEPFSALDWDVKDKLIKDLRKILKEKNISAVFVTHSADDAFLFSDKVFALKGNSLVPVLLDLEKKHGKKYFGSKEFFDMKSKLMKSIL
jgi:ABC-type nitrate/sulfonate/bicarbonate transport system ATPase subunit